MGELRKARIYASGNEDAIRALQMGAAPATAIKAVRVGDGVGVGIDVTNWEAIKAHPLRQTLAAFGDAGLLYATKEIVDSLDDGDASSSISSSTSTTSGGDTIIIDGDGNTVSTGDQKDSN